MKSRLDSAKPTISDRNMRGNARELVIGTEQLAFSARDVGKILGRDRSYVYVIWKQGYLRYSRTPAGRQFSTRAQIEEFLNKCAA